MSVSSNFRRLIGRLAYPAFEECGPIELLVIQATPFCNIDCSYCYLKERSNKKRMSPDVMEAVFRAVASSTLVRAPYTIAWHAGEPLTVGVDYYRKAFDLIKRISPNEHSYRHSIQTNGTLIDQEWVQLFKEHNVRVGISIDGPALINDRYRKARNGAGTHARVMHGIELLRKNDVEFHTISVVTKDSINFPLEVLRFLVEVGSTYICFNVEEAEAANFQSSLDNSSREQFQKFISAIFDEVRRSKIPIRVREIEGAIDAIQSWDGRFRGLIVGDNQQIHPYKIVNVDTDGNFSTYSPELLGERVEPYGLFNIGNVRTESFEQAYNSVKFRRIYRDIQSGVDECRSTCDYFQFCGGGTPANKYFENGSLVSSETVFCRMHRKAVIDGVLERISHSTVVPTSV